MNTHAAFNGLSRRRFLQTSAAFAARIALAVGADRFARCRDPNPTRRRGPGFVGTPHQTQPLGFGTGSDSGIFRPRSQGRLQQTHPLRYDQGITTLTPRRVTRRSRGSRRGERLPRENFSSSQSPGKPATCSLPLTTTARLQHRLRGQPAHSCGSKTTGPTIGNAYGRFNEAKERNGFAPRASRAQPAALRAATASDWTEVHLVR